MSNPPEPGAERDPPQSVSPQAAFVSSPGSARGVSHPMLFAWILVAALWPVAMLNYLDRQMMSTIRVSMRADIPSIANDQDFGMLMSAFLWVYALLSPLGGFVADKFNRRWTVIGSLFVWSAVTWLTGHMHTYHQMLACRALMGISEAFYMPAALALIADFHNKTRARAIGIHQSGQYCGLALGGIGAYIAQTSSWRNSFTWFGLGGVLYSVVLILVLWKARSPSEHRRPKQPQRDDGRRVTLGETLRALLSQPAYWILLICFTLPGVAGWATKNWLPTFLADRFHLGESSAGFSATLYIHLASLAGVLLGGVLADFWMKATQRGRIYTSALGTLVLAPTMLALALSWSMPAAIGCTVVFGLGWGLFDCNSMPILCQIARAKYRATGYGIMNLVGIAVGGGVTVFMGRMRDQGLSFSLAFEFSAVVAVISAALLLFIRPRANLDD
jgi:MFS transporter, Spinster family, sphingosine-1-phosphate transporter